MVADHIKYLPLYTNEIDFHASLYIQICSRIRISFDDSDYFDKNDDTEKKGRKKS